MQFPRSLWKPALALLLCDWLAPTGAYAKSAQQIDAEVNAALTKLYEINGTAKALAPQAKGILVFGKVVKGGLIIGGSRGLGSLMINGKKVAYYQTNSGSIGLQAGIEERSEVIMFMTDESLKKFQNSDNWEAGVDGSIAVINAGTGGDVTTKTAQAPIIGFIFGNSGLFAGVSFEGSKISHYTPE